MGEVDQPFKIFEGYPRMEIQPSTSNTLDDIPVVSGCLILVEYVDNPHPLDFIQVREYGNLEMLLTTHYY